MKKAISIMMVITMLVFTFMGYADLKTLGDPIVTSHKAQQVKVLEEQLLDLNQELVELKAKLFKLTGSDRLELDVAQTSSKAIIVPGLNVSDDDDAYDDDDDDAYDDDDDTNDDENEDNDENEDEDDDEDEDDEDEDEDEDDDDDDDIDGVSGATSTASVVAPSLTVQQLEANKLKLEIIALMQKIEAVKVELKLTIIAELRAQIDAAKSAAQNGQSDLKLLSLNSVLLKGVTFNFDVPPVIKGGRTLVPVRAFAEGLGAQVTWDQLAQKITITYQGKTILLQLGKQSALVNGKEVKLDAPAEILKSRTLVPLRFVAETFGLSVVWHPENEMITLERLQVVVPPLVVKPAVTTPTPKPTTTTPTPTPTVDTVSGPTTKN